MVSSWIWAPLAFSHFLAFFCFSVFVLLISYYIPFNYLTFTQVSYVRIYPRVLFFLSPWKSRCSGSPARCLSAQRRPHPILKPVRTDQSGGGNPGSQNLLILITTGSCIYARPFTYVEIIYRVYLGTAGVFHRSVTTSVCGTRPLGIFYCNFHIVLNGHRHFQQKLINYYRLITIGDSTAPSHILFLFHSHCPRGKLNCDKN